MNVISLVSPFGNVIRIAASSSVVPIDPQLEPRQPFLDLLPLRASSRSGSRRPLGRRRALICEVAAQLAGRCCRRKYFCIAALRRADVVDSAGCPRPATTIVIRSPSMSTQRVLGHRCSAARRARAARPRRCRCATSGRVSSEDEVGLGEGGGERLQVAVLLLSARVAARRTGRRAVACRESRHRDAAAASPSSSSTAAAPRFEAA